MKNHLMIDIETLSTRPDAVIASVGAVFFDPLETDIGDKLYTRLDIDHQVNIGRAIDGSTIRWWFSQDKEALHEVLHGTMDPVLFVSEFRRFIDNQPFASQDIILWANPPSFDLVILKSLLVEYGYWPFNHYNEMCMRTIKRMAEANITDFEVDDFGVKHRAIDDVVYQIKVLQSIFKQIAPPCPGSSVG